VLTETITPSYLITQRQVRTPRAVHNASPGQSQGEANQLGVQGRPTTAITGYMGGGPWTSRPPPGQYAVKGTLCRALSSAMGVRGPPRRPHGISAELKDASWATKKFPENSASILATPGDPRADVSAKRSCPQAPRGVARVATPTMFRVPRGWGDALSRPPSLGTTILQIKESLGYGGARPPHRFPTWLLTSAPPLR